jgi:hypothetical protein
MTLHLEVLLNGIRKIVELRGPLGRGVGSGPFQLLIKRNDYFLVSILPAVLKKVNEWNVPEF